MSLSLFTFGSFAAAETGLWADHCPIWAPFWVNLCPASRMQTSQADRLAGESYILSLLQFFRYANGLIYAFSSLILGWCVDHLDWPRTWLLVAANLLLAGMFLLEVGLCISVDRSHLLIHREKL